MYHTFILIMGFASHIQSRCKNTEKIKLVFLGKRIRKRKTSIFSRKRACCSKACQKFYKSVSSSQNLPKHSGFAINVMFTPFLFTSLENRSIETISFCLALFKVTFLHPKKGHEHEKNHPESRFAWICLEKMPGKNSKIFSRMAFFQYYGDLPWYKVRNHLKQIHDQDVVFVKKHICCVLCLQGYPSWVASSKFDPMTFFLVTPLLGCPWKWS